MTSQAIPGDSMLLKAYFVKTAEYLIGFLELPLFHEAAVAITMIVPRLSQDGGANARRSGSMVQSSVVCSEGTCSPALNISRQSDIGCPIILSM